MNTFRILEASDERDRAEWLSVLAEWPDHEVFSHPDYVRLFLPEGGSAHAALYRAGRTGGILYPFIVRSLLSEEWFQGNSKLRDLTTPYGYGGPFRWGALSPQALDRFWQLFDGWLGEHQIVTSFARLSLFTTQIAPFKGNTRVAGTNIVRTLDMTPDEMWMDYAHKVRKNVSRAERVGARAEAVPPVNGLEDFLRIYEQTMSRRQADDHYYFPQVFFEQLVTKLEKYVLLFQVAFEDEVVASEIVLVSHWRLYSFLGGTATSGFPVRANDLLKHRIIMWGLEHRKTAFVLGGGYSPDDGIFRYKRSFAPNGSVPFMVGTAIHDALAYAKLGDMRRAWEKARGNADWKPKGDFFPNYRQ